MHYLFITFRSICRWRYGNRELLVNEFDSNDISNFEVCDTFFFVIFRFTTLVAAIQVIEVSLNSCSYESTKIVQTMTA